MKQMHKWRNTWNITVVIHTLQTAINIADIKQRGQFAFIPVINDKCALTARGTFPLKSNALQDYSTAALNVIALSSCEVTEQGCWSSRVRFR